jgi:hypothetical protein
MIPIVLPFKFALFNCTGMLIQPLKKTQKWNGAKMQLLIHLTFLQVARFVTLKRSRPSYPENTNDINVREIEVYGPQFNKYKVETAIVHPVLANDKDQFGSQYLTDGEVCRDICSNDKYCLPHTGNTPNAYMTLDLGSPQPISIVKIYNRLNCCKDRMLGTTLNLGSNSDGSKPLLSIPIEVVKDEYTVNVMTREVSGRNMC